MRLGTLERMVRDVDRGQVERLHAAGAQLVDVLPAEEYEEEHIPGAISLPLRRVEGAREVLDRTRPVVVYCFDSA